MFYHNISFQEFNKQFGDKYRSSVQLFFADPPFNCMKEERDKFSTKDMEDLIDFAYHVIKPGGTLVLLCGFDQQQTYRKILLATKLYVQPMPMHFILSSKCKYVILFNIINKIDQKIFKDFGLTKRSVVYHAILAHKKKEDGTYYWNYRVICYIIIIK